MHNDRLHLDTNALRITADVEPPHLTVRLRGEMDLATADLLQAVTTVELGGVTTVTLDLSRLSFCDVAGLRACLAFRSRHAAGSRDVRIIDPQANVRRLWDVAGVGDLIAV